MLDHSPKTNVPGPRVSFWEFAVPLGVTLIDVMVLWDASNIPPPENPSITTVYKKKQVSFGGGTVSFLGYVPKGMLEFFFNNHDSPKNCNGSTSILPQLQWGSHLLGQAGRAPGEKSAACGSDFLHGKCFLPSFGSISHSLNWELAPEK